MGGHPCVYPQAQIQYLHASLTTCNHVQAVVNFGATWCSHCQSIFPHFLRIAKQVLLHGGAHGTGGRSAAVRSEPNRLPEALPPLHSTQLIDVPCYLHATEAGDRVCGGTGGLHAQGRPGRDLYPHGDHLPKRQKGRRGPGRERAADTRPRLAADGRGLISRGADVITFEEVLPNVLLMIL